MLLKTGRSSYYI